MWTAGESVNVRLYITCNCPLFPSSLSPSLSLCSQVITGKVALQVSGPPNSSQQRNIAIVNILHQFETLSHEVQQLYLYERIIITITYLCVCVCVAFHQFFFFAWDRKEKNKISPRSKREGMIEREGAKEFLHIIIHVHLYTYSLC